MISRSALLLTAAALGIAACQPTASPSDGQANPTGPKRAAEQVLKIGTNFFPNGLTPFWSAFSFNYTGNQFDALTRFDKDYQIQPGVAEKWELLPDNSAWRFTIRKDMTFSNGDKLTAEDVAFTVENGRKERIPIAQQDAYLTGARVVDAYTVDLLIREKNVATLFLTPSWQIFPKKYYESVGKDAFIAKPIGSGPYTVAEYNPGDTVVYKLRPDKHPYRKAELSEIRIKNIPEPTQMITGVQLGELDFALGQFSPDQAKQSKDRSINVLTPPKQASYSSLLFVKDAIKGTPLEDRRVRLAMNYAVDKETISKTLYAGFSEPLGQLTVPGDPAYNPSVRPVPFDATRAKALLAEAGYPNGFRIAGGLQFVPRPQSTAVLTAVQSMHRDVGILYELVPLESGRYVQIAYGTGGADKARTEFLSADGSNNNGIWTFPWGFLKCDQPAPIYCNPATDTSMFAALQETDQAKRNAHLQTALKAWTDEYPMVFLVSVPQFTLATQKVQGFEWTTQVFYYLDGIYKTE